MNTYEKRYKADGTYDIWEIRQDGKERIVQKTCSNLQGVDINSLPEVAYVAPDLTVNALAITRFTKLEIRRAMRERGEENLLDNLLNSSAEFKADWNDAAYIDTSDPVTAAALAAASFDVDAIKLKIAGVSND